MKPRVYVGTSGWLYPWNPRGSLDWYVEHSGLNAVELNASFYRLPRPGQVGSWRRRGSSLRWAVKVHRRVTHVHRLNPRGLGYWHRFHSIFKPMDGLVDFYLFQLPPSYTATPGNVERLEKAAGETGLGERMAVEFRHASWLDTGLGLELCRRLGVTFVSIDSPIGVYIARSSPSLYLRMHGRTQWYSHNYSDTELREDAEKALSQRPERLYVFFNNNHDMLENARRMKKLLETMTSNTSKPLAP